MKYRSILIIGCVAVGGAVALGVSGCGDQDQAATTAKPKARKPPKPKFVRAWERQVKDEETLYIRGAGYTPEVYVKCSNTKVPRGSKLQGSCETESYGTKTGDIMDAEELPERYYDVVYTKGRPGDFNIEAPQDDPLHVSP